MKGVRVQNGDTVIIRSKITLRRDGVIISETEEITVTPRNNEGYNWTADQLSDPPRKALHKRGNVK